MNSCESYSHSNLAYLHTRPIARGITTIAMTVIATTEGGVEIRLPSETGEFSALRLKSMADGIATITDRATKSAS